jgi:hypothetical protein
VQILPREDKMKLFRSLLTVIAINAAVIGVESCKTANPVATAAQATPENKAETIAYALHNSYTVVAENAATLVEQPTTPVAVKRIIVDLNKQAYFAATKLKAAAQKYNEVRLAFSKGQTTADKVAIALSQLNYAITEGATQIGALASQVTVANNKTGGSQ